jgi:FAD:protein FMN transferase
MAAPASALTSEGLVTPDGMARFVFEAMGTTVSLLLPSARADESERVERLFAHWQAVCTRFDPESELSRLNRSAGRPFVVGSLLFGVLSTAQRAAQATDGLFDPTLLHSLEAIGYDRDFAEIADGTGPASGEPLPRTGAWRGMELDPERRAVRLPAGSALDLGGLAKGMAVDAALVELAAVGVTSAALDAGGDLGVSGQPPGGSPWPIAIEAPSGVRVVSLPSGALATSSSSRRRWRQGHVMRHHLIDPRTGLPSQQDVWSATVAAPTCAQAEVAAKAAFLLGPDAGARFLADRQLAGLFLLPDGRERQAGPWIAA